MTSANPDVTGAGKGSVLGGEVDLRRRRFLLAATSVVGGVAVAGASIPFLASMAPSDATKAAGAPIDVDISKLKPAELITVTWRSRPIWVLHRSKKQLGILQDRDADLKDPHSKAPQQLPRYANPHRSIKPEYLVAVAICTHLGCIPTYRPEIAPPDLGPQWKGGFFCPCHGSRYDLAARVFDGSPAPLNIPIPPNYYRKDTVIRVGETENGGHQNWTPKIW
ncbi:MAG TPA: ubiquinol-cytochrome c reductase iron-sulfur subunit [Gammaproteobacteria bacterium]|nr:ubiquinol-cytochrome c reductase iron-sulfur subunit [Gammaproteobacteria bacterium]